MNFITFGAQFTNLFPASNSVGGGQLLTEYNLKSRESVATDPNVTYSIGPSFVHSDADFEVSILQDSGGAIINGYTLSIAEGRGVINGHYVETLAPMTIDLVEANAQLVSQSKAALKGSLAIGIRTFFSTDQTVAGSILVEDDKEMFLGVQLVVLPEEEMITPSDSPTDPSKVTCDLVLAKFTFLNNSIAGLKNLSAKTQYLSSDRVKNLDDIVSEKYVTKYGLNSKRLYVFAGKGIDPETGKDTWEDATDSIMVWDSEPTKVSEKPEYKQAQIITNSIGSYLVLPHKQVTGMTDDDGNNQYYAPRILELPLADYSTGAVGLVTKSYTNHIKDLATQVSLMKTTVNGKQIKYMDVRSISDELPSINDAWNYGDYILVGIDEYYNGGAGDESQPPATMYVVLPGYVKTLLYIGSLDGDASDEPGIPDGVLGAELGFLEWYESAGQSAPDIEYPEYYPEFYDADTVRGVPRSSTGEFNDYFRLRFYKEEEDSDNPKYPFTDYFYGVTESGDRTWSEAVLVTGYMPFATETTIGGFLNASEEATDYGYVYLDDTGHLRLLDYALLRSGTLAYQIGSDVTIPTSDDLSELQNYLSEYVNERVAFPSSTTQTLYPPIINIYLTLPESDEGGTLVIQGIDSRFNTAVCLHILGSGTSNIAINISDCEKFMIDPTIAGSPVINTFRTNLFYDPVVFNYIKSCIRDASTYGTYTGFKDLRVWFEQVDNDSPKLLASGMTVSELDSPILSASINYWKELGTASNDNNYLVALRSITFSGSGDIVACEILAANNSTDNVDPGDKIVIGEFTLPQGENLIYPEACLTKKLKITGNFTSAYYSDENWYVTDNSFTMQTGVYSLTSTANTIQGTVAFHSVTTLVPSTITQTSIDVWEPDSYHVFRGGVIS